MGTATSPSPVKLIIALMGRDSDLLAAARRLLAEQFGPIDSESVIYPFTFSTYYEKEMGASLIKQFISMTVPVDPESLADIKALCNELEIRFPQPTGQPGRSVNIDPGYMTPAKLVLATTKDYSHRIYLRRGIYAEVTLQFRHGAFHVYPWTYPDYSTPMALEYFSYVRRRLLEQE